MGLATTNYGRTSYGADEANYGGTGMGEGGQPEPPPQTGGPPPSSTSPTSMHPAKKAAYARLRTAYRNVFGPTRTVTDEELESHLAGRYDDATVTNAIRTIVHSQEAEGYRGSDANKNYVANQANAYARLKAAYKKYLGREGTPDEYESHFPANGMDRYGLSSVEAAISVIANSPEAQAYTERGGGSAEGGGEGTTREDRDKLTWNSTGRMLGFAVGSDYGGDLKARNSVKNTFGRLASRYPNTPEGLKQLMADAEFRKYFPNATLVSGGAGDKINFGGVQSDFESGTPVYEVDVLVNSNPETNTADGWAWQPAGGASPTPTPTQTPATPAKPQEPTPDQRLAAGRTVPTGSPWVQNFYDYLQSQQRL